MNRDVTVHLGFEIQNRVSARTEIPGKLGLVSKVDKLIGTDSAVRYDAFRSDEGGKVRVD